MYGYVLQFFNLNSNTFNPLATILNQNKLVGSNYVDWKRNLDIVLSRPRTGGPRDRDGVWCCG